MRRIEWHSTKSLIDKLGVKPDYRIVLLGVNDQRFLKELQARTSNIANHLSTRADMIFYQAEKPDELPRIEKLQHYIKKNGAIWVVTPKGTEQIKQTDVINAAKHAGLVDVKVVSFSPTHTALKLVIPLSRR